MLVDPDVTMLEGPSSRRTKEIAVKLFTQVAAAVSLLVTVAIVGTLFYRAIDFVITLAAPSDADIENAGAPLGLDLLWSNDQWAPRFNRFDIKTLIVGSLIVTTIAMLVAGPLGLGAAIYLSEYASAKYRRILKPILEILAGIPSIVIAFFALRFIAPKIVQPIFDTASQSLLAAGLGVGLLTIPLVASISEDALRSVPNSLREASAGMGARKMRTTLTVVTPAAVSGLVAAGIVGISRAIGETMVVFLVAGGGGNSALFTANPLEKGSTMTAAMASQASGSDNIISDVAENSLYFVGAVLFLTTFLLNILADRVVRRFRERY